MHGTNFFLGTLLPAATMAFYDPGSQRGTEDARREKKTVNDMGARAWAGTELVEGDRAPAMAMAMATATN
jgi:hypothetical protein